MKFVMELLSHLTVCYSVIAWNDSGWEEESADGKGKQVKNTTEEEWKSQNFLHCISPFGAQIEYDPIAMKLLCVGCSLAQRALSYRYRSLYNVHVLLGNWTNGVFILSRWILGTRRHTLHKLYLIQWKIYNNINIQQQVPNSCTSVLTLRQTIGFASFCLSKHSNSCKRGRAGATNCYRNINKVMYWMLGAGCDERCYHLCSRCSLTCRAMAIIYIWMNASQSVWALQVNNFAVNSSSIEPNSLFDI